MGTKSLMHRDHQAVTGTHDIQLKYTKHDAISRPQLIHYLEIRRSIDLDGKYTSRSFNPCTWN